MQLIACANLRAISPHHREVPDGDPALSIPNTPQREKPATERAERGRNARADTKQPVWPAWGRRMVNVPVPGGAGAEMDAPGPTGLAGDLVDRVVAGGAREHLMLRLVFDAAKHDENLLADGW